MIFSGDLREVSGVSRGVAGVVWACQVDLEDQGFQGNYSGFSGAFEGVVIAFYDN